MTAKRVYKDPISQEESFKELKRCSGTQFDPNIVAAFEKVYMLIHENN